MKNFFFKTKWNIIFLFIPFLLILLFLFSGLITALVFHNHYLTIYENEWKDKLLSRAQTFYVQIQQTIAKETNVLSVNYMEDTEDIRPTVSIPSIVYDRNGNKIGYYGSERRDYISLEEMSRYFIYTLLASEDKRFFSHFGIDLKRTIGVAIYIALFKDTSRGGGSSITQQLARYLMDWHEVKLERKIIEMLGAIDLERRYSKKQILEMYCNYVPFSHGAYGVENASQTFFGKSARNLTLGEAALLVGVIPNPAKFSPFKKDPKKLQVSKDRHKRVLYQLVEAKFIPELNSYEKADKIHSEFWKDYNFDKIKRISRTTTRFEPNVAYVGEQVRKELMGISEDYEKMLVEGGGLSIYTTIDLKYEGLAQNIVKEGVELYRQEIREYDYETLKQNIIDWKKAIIGDEEAEVEVTDEEVDKAIEDIQSALVLINNSTGEIISFVGGDGFTSSNQFIRSHQSKRQPGSAFKPLLYYNVLNTKKVNMFSMYDSPKEITLLYGEDKEWKVPNFEGFTYGVIPLIKALYKSVNTIAAVLIRDIGIAPIRNSIKKILNLSEKEALKRFPNEVYSLALGTVVMSPLEMATVYSTIARLGKRVKPYLISKVYDHKGSLLIDNEKEAERYTQKQILAKETTYILTKMMHHVLSGGWDNGGTAARIRKISHVPKKINVNFFDEILDSYPSDEKEVGKIKSYILKYYEKDEDNNLYILKENVSEDTTKEILKKLKKITYNHDLKGWYIAKTGTTNNNTDAWLCGANDKYTLVVWIGNDNNIPLLKTGGEAAGPIWGKFMLKLEEDYIAGAIETEDLNIYKYGVNNNEEDTENNDFKILISNYNNYDLINIPMSLFTGKIAIKGLTPEKYIDYDATFYVGTEPGNFDTYADYPELKDNNNNSNEDNKIVSDFFTSDLGADDDLENEDENNNENDNNESIENDNQNSIKSIDEEESESSENNSDDISNSETENDYTYNESDLLNQLLEEYYSQKNEDEDEEDEDEEDELKEFLDFDETND